MPKPLLCVLCLMTLTTGCGKPPADGEIRQRVAGIDSRQLQKHVEHLTALGPRSTQHPAAVRSTVEYLTAQLGRFGYRTSEEATGRSVETPGGSYTFVNVIAEITGSDSDPEIVELGAHYDTVVNSPGADDNASGVAALLEIARVLHGSRPEHTVRFCLFALEEDGRDGSRTHVQRLRRERQNMTGAIIFEMIGYADSAPDSQASPARVPLLFWPPESGDFIAVIGNFRSGSVGNRFEDAARRYVPRLRYFSANRLGGLFRDALRSDHKPYWDARFRAIMLTDTANFRNPHYHRDTDLPQTLDYEFLRSVSQATAATLLEWSGPHALASLY